MSDFAYIAEPWLHRAQIAREAGVELGELAGSLENVVSRYYFGTDCEEGVALHSQLRALLQTAREDLRTGSETALDLAENSTQAAEVLSAADESNSTAFNVHPR